MISIFDFRPIFLVTGVLLSMLGVAMLFPALIDLAASNPDWRVFASASALTLLVGLGLFASNRGAPSGLSTRQAMLMTVISWMALVTFGAIPYLCPVPFRPSQMRFSNPCRA